MQTIVFKYFPLIGFLFIWSLVLFLHSLGLYNIRPISNETRLIIFCALFSFMMSYIMVTAYNTDFDREFKKEYKLKVNINLLIKLVIGISLLSYLGALLSAYAISKDIGGISIYFSRPLMVRQEVVELLHNKVYGTPILFRLGNYLINIGFISTLLGGILLASGGRFRLWGLFPLLGVLISQLVTFGRYYFVNGLVFFFTAYVLFIFFNNKKDQLRQIGGVLLYSFLSVSIIMILSYYVLKWRSPLANDIIALVKESFYFYFVGGVTALDINHQIHDFKPSMGVYSFRSIYEKLALFNLYDKELVKSVFNPFVKVSPSYSVNTKTFINPLLQDFKIYGVLFISSIWAILTSFFTLRFYKTPSLLNLLIVSILTFSLIISFFSFYFQSITMMVYWGLVVFAIQYSLGDKLFIIETK